MFFNFEITVTPGSEIPDSPYFKAAFAIATAVYVISMIVIFLLLRRSLKKLPKEPNNKENLSEERDNIRNTQHIHRQSESETEPDPRKA